MASLTSYEVIIALLGTYFKEKKTDRICLKDRSVLYQSVMELCKKKPDLMFNFEFRTRSGILTSPDVDLCIRNLEDSKRLECHNPALVDFTKTSVFTKEYTVLENEKLKELGLSELVKSIATGTLSKSSI